MVLKFRVRAGHQGDRQEPLTPSSELHLDKTGNASKRTTEGTHPVCSEELRLHTFLSTKPKAKNKSIANNIKR